MLDECIVWFEANAACVHAGTWLWDVKGDRKQG